MQFGKHCTWFIAFISQYEYIMEIKLLESIFVFCANSKIIFKVTPPTITKSFYSRHSFVYNLIYKQYIRTWFHSDVDEN